MKVARSLLLLAVAALLLLFASPASIAGDAPGWMHSVANGPLPPHDEKTDAILLYAEQITIVQSDSKMKHIERKVYKILRPGGRDEGIAVAWFDSNLKITGMRGWCIPTQGKDYEVKDKDAVEVSLAGVQFSELVTDTKDKLLRIPAAEPGNVVGYEIESEQRPYILQDWWLFQHSAPVREARYTLQLPAGWEYKAVWLNHTEIRPSSVGNNQWQWVVNDVAGIRPEERMPPANGLAGQMLVSLLPPGGSNKQGFENWAQLAKWEMNLVQGRRDPSPELKQKTLELTSNAPSTLAKMQALAQFAQHDIRYVAIELGIGGWQPHPANEVFVHRYGDCKDKVTLMSAMLKEIGIESYYILINAERGGVNPQTPPMPYWFNHAILAIRLPGSLNVPSLLAVYQHPSLGRMLIFDPTNEMIPLGLLPGYLQDNFGLLATEEGGELIKLPQLPPSSNGVHREGKFTLSPSGTLTGAVEEVLLGDRAAEQRFALQAITKDADRIKPIETILSRSLGTFQITKASIGNLQYHERQFEFIYSFTADRYAKSAGDLLLVRLRILGNKSDDLLEKKEPRKFPVEFDGPVLDEDSFEITLPPGYEVDELPPPADAEFSFASYHSKTEIKGNVLLYRRSYQIKELSVPVEKLDQLKMFYRVIANDERNTAVLKPTSH